MCLPFLQNYEANTLKVIKDISDKTFDTQKLNTFIDLKYYLIDNLNLYTSVITNSDDKIHTNTKIIVIEFCYIRYITKDNLINCVKILNSSYNISYYQFAFLQKYFEIVFDNSEIDVLSSFCRYNNITDISKIKALIYEHYFNKKLKKLINLY